MEQIAKLQIAEAFEDFEAAAVKLSRVIHENEQIVGDEINAANPLNESFDETVVKMMDWKNKSVENINKI